MNQPCVRVEEEIHVHLRVVGSVPLLLLKKEAEPMACGVGSDFAPVFVGEEEVNEPWKGEPGQKGPEQLSYHQ